MSVPRHVYINKIRELGYFYKAQQRRTFLYRLRGGLDFISVPRSEDLEDAWVETTLKRAGLTEEEAKKFIGAAKT